MTNQNAQAATPARSINDSGTMAGPPQDVVPAPSAPLPVPVPRTLLRAPFALINEAVLWSADIDKTAVNLG